MATYFAWMTEVQKIQKCRIHKKPVWQEATQPAVSYPAGTVRLLDAGEAFCVCSLNATCILKLRTILVGLVLKAGIGVVNKVLSMLASNKKLLK